MAKKKACKKCGIFVEGSECPLCKGNQFTTSWNGRITIIDPSKSEIGKKIGKEVKGEYALKTR